VCSGCRGHELKESGIDWAERTELFEELVTRVRGRATGYDCIVPVSGGKDSWYQVIICQQYGLKVLGVTWRTPARTPVGQANLDNMVRRLGIDHIDVTIAPHVEARFMKAAFEERGATAIPMHMALFAIPIRMAAQFEIPLIVWGENPQLEFGGETADQLSTVLNRTWLHRHGVTDGTTHDDWVGFEGLTEQDLVPYQLPPDDAFRSAPESIFLGAFFPWDSRRNARVAAEHGFHTIAEPRTGVWEFADLDCDFISLHHFLKWYKFGITRAFDNLSVEIRHGWVTRDEAIATLAELGPQIPEHDIELFCKFVGEPTEWFWNVAEGFRNPDIWHQVNGTWRIDDFLVPGWPW
jgi:N-acetyl sugar amidotransferase